MILIIDNYDSFTYNLVQYVGSINNNLKIIKNDALALDVIKIMDPSHIIISAGPGGPKNTGICLDVIDQLSPFIPTLGICLGHQAIGYHYNAKIMNSKNIIHGETSIIRHNNQSLLFNNMKVWNSNNMNPDTRFKIGEKLKEILDLDLHALIQYKENYESIQDGSTYRNARNYVFQPTQTQPPDTQVKKKKKSDNINSEEPEGGGENNNEINGQANHHQTMATKAQGALEVMLQMIPKQEVEEMISEEARTNETANADSGEDS